MLSSLRSSESTWRLERAAAAKSQGGDRSCKHHRFCRRSYWSCEILGYSNLRSVHRRQRDRLLLWITVIREVDSPAVALIGDEETESGRVLWDRCCLGRRVADLKGSNLQCHRLVVGRELLHVIREDLGRRSVAVSVPCRSCYSPDGEELLVVVDPNRRTDLRRVLCCLRKTT